MIYWADKMKQSEPAQLKMLNRIPAISELISSKDNYSKLIESGVSVDATDRFINDARKSMQLIRMTMTSSNELMKS